MTETQSLRAEQLEVLKVIYPLYKEEVFRRREQMMRLTALASTFLVILLVTTLAIPSHPYPDFTTALFAITGVALFTTLFIFLILQQRNRHRMAKQALIEIERALGLYDEGLHVVGKALLPEDWQTAWLGDHSVTVYLTFLTTLAALVVAAVLLRA